MHETEYCTEIPAKDTRYKHRDRATYNTPDTLEAEMCYLELYCPLNTNKRQRNRYCIDLLNWCQHLCKHSPTLPRALTFSYLEMAALLRDTKIICTWQAASGTV